jgi:hypothetical protein
MLGATLPARVVPTAMALLALRRLSSKDILAADIAALHAGLFADHGPLAQAWGLLAWREIGGLSDPPVETGLNELQQPDGSIGGNALATALAVLSELKFEL